MTNRYWQTGSPKPYTQPLTPPSPAQTIKQLGIMGVIGAAWLATLIVFLGVLMPPVTSATVAQVSPTDLPAPAITSTTPPTAAPTVQPTRTSTPPPRATSTARPTPTPTARPTVEPTIAPTVQQPTAAPITSPTAAPIAGGQVSYANDVQPLFDRLCVKCHGGEKTEEGLVLKSYAEVMAGSFNGPVVVPGDTAGSLLVDLITKGEMPKRGPRLLPGELRTITDWVAQGARNN